MTDAPERIWTGYDHPHDNAWFSEPHEHTEAEYVRADLYAKQAERIGELEAAIDDADSIVNIEINPSNYGHDDVCLLKGQIVEAFSVLTAALKGPANG